MGFGSAARGARGQQEKRGQHSRTPEGQEPQQQVNFVNFEIASACQDSDCPFGSHFYESKTRRPEGAEA